MLRELGEKVKRMEKLGSVDLLEEVHEAAEELQKKVDKKSYLLVNAESWEIGGRQHAQVNVPQEVLAFDDDTTTTGHHFKSLSEAKLDLSSIQMPSRWDDRNSSHNALAGVTSEKHELRPSHETAPMEPEEEEEEESRTYENASALSLATFTSLLIEFVARLQNLVDAFEELSEKGKFNEPVELPDKDEAIGLWSRLTRYVKLWRKDDNLLAGENAVRLV